MVHEAREYARPTKVACYRAVLRVAYCVFRVPSGKLAA